MSSMINESNIRSEKITPMTPPGKKKKRKAALIIAAILVSATVAGLLLMRPKEDSYNVTDYQSSFVLRGSLTESIQASGTVTIPRQVDLPSRQEGYAQDLRVSEGASITTEDILAELSVPDLEEELEDLEAQLSTSYYQLEKAQKESQFDISRMERDMERLREELNDAIEEENQQKELYELNASRLSDWEQAQETREDLEDQLDEDLRSLEEKIVLDAISLEAQEADLLSIQRKIERAQEEIQEASITSPIDGDLLYVNQALAVEGNLIEQNTVLFTVADRESALVELEVYEEYAQSLEVGQVLTMTISNRQVPGTILSIGQYAESSSDGLGASVTVTVRPDQSGGLLTPGATAVADLDLGTIENTLYLPRGSYLTTGSQKYVFRIQNGLAEKVEVQFGSILDSAVQIISGLEEGDEIITSGYQNFIQYNHLTLGE